MTLAPTHALPSPGAVMARLNDLDADLAALRPEFEQAAQSFYLSKRHYEKALAEALLQAEGKSVDERKAAASLAVERTQAYHAFIEAEGRYEGAKAALRVIDTRVGVGQSLLRAMSREAA